MPLNKNSKRMVGLRAYQDALRAKKADALQNTSLLDIPTPVPSIVVTPATSLPSSPAPSVPPSVATCDAKAPPNTPIINNHQPPPLELVEHAIPILEAVVNPKRPSGSGHLRPKLNPLAVKDLSSVLELFRVYTAKDITWRQASIDVSNAKGHGKGHAESLRAWGRAYLADPSYIPRTSYGHSQAPLIQCDDFREEIQEYLRGAGKYISSTTVIQFTAQSDVQKAWRLTRAISKSTAQRWMRDLQYRWGRQQKGMYLDGHERPDVVNYRQGTFLIIWNGLEPRMQSYAMFEYTYMDPIIRRVVVWFHDESTFYAWDRRLLLWILMSADHKPSKKGEGPSLMVSDFVSADYGWLRSPDGKECAREFFQAGKNRDGYFSSSHVCEQVAHATEMVSKYYPGEDHVFVFDNSPTHTKRGSDAPSAQRMPKYTPKPTSKNFLVRTADEDGNEIEVPMTGAYFSDGRPQSLYWPKDHPRAGWFKGMAQIARERGWENAEKIRARCKKCPNGRTDCCLRRILFNEPDFANPTSILERLVTSRGHGFLLLPKFHPELNPIEQCWAEAKRVFRELPESRGPEQLEEHVKKALDSVDLEQIQKYCTRSRRICDGYTKGLDGRLSVWAAKRYHGHRQYPQKILEEMEDWLKMRNTEINKNKARL